MRVRICVCVSRKNIYSYFSYRDSIKTWFIRDECQIGTLSRIFQTSDKNWIDFFGQFLEYLGLSIKRRIKNERAGVHLTPRGEKINLKTTRTEPTNLLDDLSHILAIAFENA